MKVPRAGDLVHVYTTSFDMDWRGMPFKSPNSTRLFVRSATNSQVREYACLWLGLLGKEGKLLDSDQRRTVMRAMDAGRSPTQHVSPLYGVVWIVGPKPQRSVVLFDEDVTELHVLEPAASTRVASR